MSENSGECVSLVRGKTFNQTMTTSANLQDLIDSVDFITNVTSYRNLHSHQLRVKAGVEHLPELPKLTDFLCEALEVDELVGRRCILGLMAFREGVLGCHFGGHGGAEGAEGNCDGESGWFDRLSGCEDAGSEAGAEHVDCVDMEV